MNNPYIHRKRSEMPSRRISLVTENQYSQNRTISTGQITNGNLNRQFLKSRRQNYLNTGYNIRKQKLEDITIENKKIYIKINSQKSAYSRDELRKSYESNASISKRLSQSKISRRQSSRSSMRSSQVNKKKGKPRLKQNYKIQTNSLASIKDSQLSKLKGIFKPTIEIENINPKTATEKSRKYSCSLNEALINEAIKLKLPPILKVHKTIRPSHAKMNVSSPKYEEGAFLHIVAEEMFRRVVNKN